MNKSSRIAVAVFTMILAVTGIVSAGPELPKDIEWLTNDTAPVFASPDAKKGGTLRLATLSFPMTFRTIGPASNGSFRSYVLDNQLEMVAVHPNTYELIPALATHWAFDKDKKTMYFKLDKKARWSDGTPITAGDFAYTLEFMRSKHIVAPWYNDYYTKEIDRVIVYDDHTLAVAGTKPHPDLRYKLGLPPTPRHYYGKLDKDFVKKYNWSIVPNTGPYVISSFKKGKNVKFKRKKDWWGKDLRYFKNRFNVDKVVITVVRDSNVIWEYFKKGKMDVFNLNDPIYWHEKAKTPVIEKGYANKAWFYTDSMRPS